METESEGPNLLHSIDDRAGRARQDSVVGQGRETELAGQRSPRKQQPSRSASASSCPASVVCCAPLSLTLSSGTCVATGPRSGWEALPVPRAVALSAPTLTVTSLESQPTLQGERGLHPALLPREPRALIGRGIDKGLQSHRLTCGSIMVQEK